LESDSFSELNVATVRLDKKWLANQSF